MRRYQPLTALRAFEAVARLKSISAAATELHVTRPAVSKQVTLLEQALGLPLLNRSGNAIQLTPAGEELLEGLQQAFDIISASMDSVRASATQSRRLRILACRDFASSWLAARVGTFLVENPGISLELIAEKNGNWRFEDDFDFRIFYGMAGEQVSGRYIQSEICHWIDLPVCTQGFADRYLSEGQPPSMAPALIDANYDIWEEWCLFTGFQSGGPREKTTIFNETTLCLSVAKSGGGLTIGDSFLALPAILAGDLVVPFPVGLLSAQSYSLYAPATRKPDAAAIKFENWLKGAVDVYQESVLQALTDRNIKVYARSDG